jgi:hypothetical protein
VAGAERRDATPIYNWHRFDARIIEPTLVIRADAASARRDFRGQESAELVGTQEYMGFEMRGWVYGAQSAL